MASIKVVKTEIQDLEIFAAVVKHGNFSKAAEELGIAASAVSRSVKKLEGNLNVKLFNRTTRKIKLTQDGEWLYQQVLEIIHKITHVEGHLSKSQILPRGTIRVDAATPFMLHAIAPVIAGFKKQYEHIKIVLTSSESTVDLIDRNVDVAIRIGDLVDSTLKARKLGNSCRKIYASPDYLKSRETIAEVRDLAGHACLGFAKPEKLNTWPVVCDNGEWLKIQPEIIADSGETLKQLAVQGCGLVCISSFTAEHDVRSGNLVCILEKHTQLVPVPIFAVFYADKQINIRLRCFLDYLAERICFDV
ncbi:LysR family transcriptional regulator [Candidatus Halocynthiibacter alkanivorans]|uniref:LysR family transcriptional regulator n=1 Tax=Candidatus Halocynthiibacter alkanivorans TaxID=2267619 RepID=UPI000DF23AF9|nr:LysR family transcriptional regulator [Candidatus Halocynthiibacter alkanivorans]